MFVFTGNGRRQLVSCDQTRHGRKTCYAQRKRHRIAQETIQRKLSRLVDKHLFRFQDISFKIICITITEIHNYLYVFKINFNRHHNII